MRQTTIVFESPLHQKKTNDSNYHRRRERVVSHIYVRVSALFGWQPIYLFVLRAGVCCLVVELQSFAVYSPERKFHANERMIDFPLSFAIDSLCQLDVRVSFVVSISDCWLKHSRLKIHSEKVYRKFLPFPLIFSLIWRKRSRNSKTHETRTKHEGKINEFEEYAKVFSIPWHFLHIMARWRM